MKKLITATVALTTLAVPSVVGVKPLVDAGYNVLTWDARGFGGSGGRIMIDDQHFEGRDVQALISHVARQPEARLDRRGDPRVGMTGASYQVRVGANDPYGRRIVVRGKRSRLRR